MATKTDVSGQLRKVEGNLKISLWKITNQCDQDCYMATLV